MIPDRDNNFARVMLFLVVFSLSFATVSGQMPSPMPSPISEKVTVVANRNESVISDTPASVTVISKTMIEASAAPNLDEILRQNVGFSTFRRSGGRTSNPTTQGVSFRGTGSSGASRAAVLFDGVPLSDPFGGWVQWERIPAIAVEQVEVLRGGASSLYGDYALSGVVNIIPRKLEQNHAFSAEVFGGVQGTFSASAFGGAKWRDFVFDATAAAFQTRGFRPVDAAARGPVDGHAGVRYTSFFTRIGREFGKTASLFVRPSIFGEVRTNGTGLQTNRTHIRQIVAGGTYSRLENFKVDWRVYGGTQVYAQTFSAVNATRTNENVTRIQSVPAQNIGGSHVFAGTIGNHSLVSGVDGRQIRGSSDEVIYTNGIATAKVGAGGRETAVGVFIRDLMKVANKLVLVGGIRFDSWQNTRGVVNTLNLSSNLTATTAFVDRSETALSPQAAMLYYANDRVSIYASASSSFRVPTLNELYRTFRVGNVNTLANADLRAERATNAEAGVNYRLHSFSFRSSIFWTKVDRAVSNVTLSTTPNLITRQRRNVGATRSGGFEIEAETTFRRLHLSAGYLFADSRVIEFEPEPTIVGLRVPQVARHQLTFQSRYTLEKWTFALQGRAAGKQFDDDQNLFRLEPFLQLDLFTSRNIGKYVKLFAAFENITNTRYSTGRTPIRTVSSPLNFRTGFRWK